MRNFKKFLTLVLAVLMVVSMVAVNTSAAKFTDVDENNEYLAKAVNLLNYVGVAKGTSETTFGTDELVTREQMAAFIYRLVKKGQSVEGGSNTSPFVDLEDPTFFFMISWANTQGIIKGTSATTFDPKGSITLQDAYVMLVRALGYEKEETLPYPFGYIDVAEQKDVELGEGLDKTVSYTDALTRGQVAILLYNTFFAETGVAETKQVSQKIGSVIRDPDTNEILATPTWVLKTETSYPTFCEKYFDVLEVEYKAVATPNYVTDGETDNTGDLGYDAIYFAKMEDDDDSDAPEYFYADVKDLAIEGEPDDYIMSHFKMYITLDKDDKVDTILYAEPLMKKKTVTEIKLETLSNNTKYSYYEDNAENAKRLSGRAIVDGESVYFYNAPYNYAKPSYENGSSDVEKYAARNEKNVKFINRVLVGDPDDKDYTYNVYDPFTGIYDDEGYFAADSEILVEELAQVYAGGLYEATFYDVDGDDLYDYIQYMPYSFAIVDVDDDYTFFDDGFDGNTIYTNEAVLEGEEFKDEAFIIGFFDQTCNYIKVAAVVEPIEGAVKSINSSSATITLSNGDKATVDDGWKLVANFGPAYYLGANGYDVEKANDSFNDFNYLLRASVLSADDAKFYVYDGAVLYTEDISNKVTLDKNIIIITEDEDGAFFQAPKLDTATGKKTTYAYAYIDGTTKYVAVDTDTDSTNIWPSIKNAEDRYYNRVATYSESNGVYTLKLIADAYDDEAMDFAKDYIGLSWDRADLEDEKDDTLQVYDEIAEGYLTKYSSKRFYLTDAAGKLDNKLDNAMLLLDNNTRIVIKNYDTEDDETTFEEFTASTLTDSIISKLTNIQYVLGNNVDYKGTRENLIFLYAETVDLETASKKASNKADRIIKGIEPQLNSDDKLVYNYTVYNPYTGATENILGSKSYSKNNEGSKFTYGDIVALNTNKLVDESEAAIDRIAEGTAYLWILEYDEENDIIYVAAPGNEDPEFKVSVADASVISLGSQGQSAGSSMVKWGSVAAVAKSKLAAKDNNLKTVNKNYEDPKTGKLKTVYGKYQKAYIKWDEASAKDKDEFDYEAEYIVIVIHSGEEIALCDIK